MSVTKIIGIIVLIIAAVIALYFLILYLDIKHEDKDDTVWHDRKRILGMPLTFEKYSFSNDRIFVSKGMLSTKEDETRLYRVLDLAVTRTLFQKIFNVGTIHVTTSDKSLGKFAFYSVKNPRGVKEKLSELVETNRDKKRVTSREYMSASDIDADEDDMSV